MRWMFLLSTVAVCALAVPVHAEDVGKVFTLGEVTTTASAPGGTAVGGSTVSQDDMREFNRDTLDKALTLVPGVTMSNMGARNETNVWIRGFDRWRTPLYQDGIPIYLPYDNRIDFQQFTTSDIGEIQVTKGFTSVIDGPGAMGGSINLVSRRVTKPFEGEARMGTSFDQNGALNGFVADSFVGSKIGNWYVQGSGTENYRNHFRLSDDYQPGGSENGGNRNKSYNQDTKFNVKVGFTPNAGDEYALNVIDQIGHKDDPPADANGVTSKYWTWPYWSKQAVYWLSKTDLDDRGSYLKTKLYYDRFMNALTGYDTSTYSTQNLGSNAAFASHYDERAAGGNTELNEVFLGGMDSVRAALHYRWDQHKEWDQYHPAKGSTVLTGIWFEQPPTGATENTYSAALENTFHPAPPWDVITGISYDYRQIISDSMWSSDTSGAAPYGTVVNSPVSDKRAVNPQLAGVYHYDQTGSVHASVSERTRFPTLFEMFSSRFGTFTGNPALRPEKSLYWETGVADTLGQTHLGANLYYARVFDAIGSVTTTVPGVSGTISQNANVGTEMHRGFELEASTQLLDSVELGGNYTYLLRTTESKNTTFPVVVLNTPMHKLFGYVDWKPMEKLSVVPSVELNSKRYMSPGNGAPPFYRAGDFALANLKVSYDILSNLQVETGVRNLFDQNYMSDYGYHAEGRSYFTNVRVQF
ncbi:MAG TPA: TonB-dependent receptor [Telmatospirillum sp.]|nr:TonB-dependent receptor [Telmatospirillum sp.]